MHVFYSSACNESLGRRASLDEFCRQIESETCFDACVVNYVTNTGLMMFTFYSKLGYNYSQYFSLRVITELPVHRRAVIAKAIVNRAYKIVTGQDVYSSTKELLPDAPDPTKRTPSTAG